MEELKLAIKQYFESRKKLQNCLLNIEINKTDKAALSESMLMKLKGISTCFTYKEVLSKKRDLKVNWTLC